MRIINEENLKEEGIIVEDIVRKVDYKDDNIFCEEEYEKAIGLIHEIMINSEIANRKEQGFIPHVNNIISFIGERGTGKTSAMMSLWYALNKYKWNDLKKNIKNIETNDETNENKFVLLQYIDIGTLKKKEDIIEIILSRMLKYFTEDSTCSENNRESMQRIYKQFDNVYKHLLNLKEKRNLQDGESAIRILRNLSSSYSIEEEIRLLIKDFLNYYKEKNNCKGNYFLVIAFDDLDLYPKNVYKILERIYEYLTIPGVIILSTCNIDIIKRKTIQYIKRNFFAKNVKENDDKLRKMQEKFLEKILPDSKRIYMPDFRRRDYLSTNANALKIRKKGTGEIVPVKEFILHLIANKTGNYFDIKGEKKHFFESRNLRELYNVYKFFDTFLHSEEGVRSAERMSNYIYEQFITRILRPEEQTVFEELSEVNIRRRSEILIENIRVERAKLRNDDKFHYSGEVDEWKYSYGELLYNLYCSTRARIEKGDTSFSVFSKETIFSKEFIHGILASYTTSLNVIYQKYIENNKKLYYKKEEHERTNKNHNVELEEKIDETTRQIEKIKKEQKYELGQFIGSSVSGSWSNKMMPRYRTNKERTLLSGEIISEMGQPIDIGAVNIRNMDVIGDINIPENIMNDNKEKSDFINRVEIILMFFSTSYQKLNDNQISRGIEQRFYVKEGKIKNAERSTCFNIMNFVINSLFYEEFYDNILVILEDLTKDKEKAKVWRDKYTMYESYKRMEYQYKTSLVLPIHQFDMVYNIIKRQADNKINGMPEEFSEGKDDKNTDFITYCIEVYTGIAKKLKDECEAYDISVEENYDINNFAGIFEACPFLKKIEQLKNDEELNAWFTNWLKKLETATSRIAIR